MTTQAYMAAKSSILDMDQAIMTYELSVNERLRASHVKRWHIVNTIRTQNVAEHSFNVAIIADELQHRLIEAFGTDILPPVYHRDRMLWERDVLMIALTHDLDEVFTGDIPASVKPRKEWQPVNIRTDLTASLVVKIADIVEMYDFITEHYVGRHGKKVQAWCACEFERMITAFGMEVEARQIIQGLAAEIMSVSARITPDEHTRSQVLADRA